MAIEDGAMELHPGERSKPTFPPQQLPDLLPEIITEILSRLPVKSLLQFRSVSKSWRSLIDHPKFAKTHYDICSQNTEIAHHRLIFRSRGGFRLLETVEKCDLSSFFNEFSVNPTDLDYPMKQPESSLFIVGSVNGLVCIGVNKFPSHDTFFFWNPVTRISKKLPPSGFEHTSYLCKYGFGYDESSDDYKLVGLFGESGSYHLDVVIVMVYSLRTDCWRRIGNFPSGQHYGWGTFVNGAIHWTPYLTQYTDLNLPFSKSIIYLDLAKETYGEVAQPSYGDRACYMSLGVMGECLSVLCDYGSRDYGSHADVWAMKEYGVRESWTKLARIPFGANYPDPDPDRFLFPWLLYISKNGEILLLMGARIVVYDPKTNLLRPCPDVDNVHAPCDGGASVYIESLVSPLIQ